MLSGPVFVGTDLTPGAEEALRQGGQLARDLGGPLIVCHVLPELLRISMLFPQWQGVDPAFERSMTGKARGAVERELESILGSQARGAQIVLDSGTPHVGLLKQAETAGAGVLVIGPGRVAAQVVRHASVPVLVARPSPRGAVVGATDFSDPSLPALTAAASEARRRSSLLHLIHAVDVGVYALGNTPTTAMPYLEGSSALALEALDDLGAAAKLRLQEALTQFVLEGETTVLSGRAEAAIVGYAETVGAELVVVGTHGRSGLARITLGSTAAAVIDSAPCSVLVVRVVGS